MPILLWIIIFSFAGSFLSMTAGFVLLLREKLARQLSLFLISFAVGVLLGVAFLDLLPEILEEVEEIKTPALMIVSAIVASFAMERFFWWFHHHRMHFDEHTGQNKYTEEGAAASKAYILLFGDAVHNFVDGVIIATAFLADFNIGIGVSIGVIAHELPQEIADFGVMLHAKFSRTKTLLLNLAAASTTFFGAILAYFIAPAVEGIVPLAISFAMGVFIYTALSDLVPEIHHRGEHRHNLIHFLLLIGGIILIGWVV